MLYTRYDVMDLDWGDVDPGKDALAARLDAFGDFIRLAHGRIEARRDPPGVRYIAVAGEYMAARPRLADERERYRRKNNGTPLLDDEKWHDTPIVDPISDREMREIVVPFLESLSREYDRHYIFLDAYYRQGNRIFNDCLLAFAGKIMKSLPKLHEDSNTKRACDDAFWGSKPRADRDRHLLSLDDEHGRFDLGFEICMDNYRRCLAELIERSIVALPDGHLKISGSDSVRPGNARVAMGGLYLRVDQGARPSRFFERTGGPDDAPELSERSPDACQDLPRGGVYKTLLHRRRRAECAPDPSAGHGAIIGKVLRERTAIEPTDADAALVRHRTVRVVG